MIHSDKEVRRSRNKIFCRDGFFGKEILIHPVSYKGPFLTKKFFIWPPHLGLPMLKFDIEIRRILSHGSTSFDWWNKISKYFDSWAIQSMSNWSFQKRKFFMSTEKIYNITEFDFRSKTITDSGSNNSNGNIHHVIIKVIWACANVLICDQN